MAGQEHVVRALTHALENDRLHHAYLFTGTRGIGKTTVSRILAKSLNCLGADGKGGVTAHPCGVCEACRAIDADRFLDYTEMDAASNRSIDEIRDLIERAAYKPSQGRFKVFMIDEAHQLTKDAFNALLKTLEEPPDYLKFVLATTDPDKMLPTVLSRCIQFNLRPMAPQTIAEHLALVLKREAVQCDAEALQLLGAAARGSMRDALSLTDQAIAYSGGALSGQGVRAMLGGVDDEQVLNLLGALARADAATVLQVVGDLRTQGRSAAATLNQLADALQDIAVEQFVPTGVSEQDSTRQARIGELAAQMATDETQLLYSMVLQGKGELAWVSDEYAALTMVLLRFLAFSANPQAPAPPNRAAALRTTAPPTLRVAVRSPPRATPSAALAKSERAVAPLPSEGPSKALADQWETVVRALIESGQISGLARELAWQSMLASVSSGLTAVWHLVVEHDSLRSEGVAHTLTQALSAHLGSPARLEITCASVSDTPAHREASRRQERIRQAESILAGDSQVQALLGQFKTARIVPGSVKLGPISSAADWKKGRTS